MEDDELRLIWLYCWLDGVVGAVTGEVGRLRERGPAPKLTDAEVLTIMIWGEILGLPSDAAIWRAAKSLLVGWFPCMVAEWNFVRRCANLIAMKDRILVLGFGPAGDFNSFDGLPLPVCKKTPARQETGASRAKLHGHSAPRRTSIITGSRQGRLRTRMTRYSVSGSGLLMLTNGTCSSPRHLACLDRCSPTRA